MGIDIYAEWDGMTKEEHAAQLTGFSPEHGHVGYLREAYHGEPCATTILVSEAFEHGRAVIPAATLRERVPEVLEIAEQRKRELYGETDAEPHMYTGHMPPDGSRLDRWPHETPAPYPADALGASCDPQCLPAGLRDVHAGDLDCPSGHDVGPGHDLHESGLYETLQ
jgi:hypothetical protein